MQTTWGRLLVIGGVAAMYVGFYGAVQAVLHWF